MRLFLLSFLSEVRYGNDFYDFYVCLCVSSWCSHLHQKLSGGLCCRIAGEEQDAGVAGMQLQKRLYPADRKDESLGEIKRKSVQQGSVQSWQ